jgi:uncharacterized protein YggT (Ycf19 family)
MNLVDLLLNLAGLLLWVGWRSIRLAETPTAPGLSLASTLERPSRAVVHRGRPLLALAGLLLARPVLYWQVGASAHWDPALDLGLVAIPFPTPSFPHMLLYSLLGFGRTLAVFYLTLLLFALLGGPGPEAGPVHGFVRLQLGRAARWPAAVLALLPLATATLLWMLLTPALVRMGLIAPGPTPGDRLQQGLLLGLAAYVLWKYPILVVLVAYLFHTHVFVGHATVWNFVGATGRTLLRPLRPLPLAFGRLDLAPLVAVALLLPAAYYAMRGLTLWFQHPPF